MLYQFAIIYQQHQAKREIKKQVRRRLSDSDLEMISYADHIKDIHWEEEGREFRMFGEMYDVVRSSSLNGKLVLYCINDKRENELINKYINLFKHKSPAEKKLRSVSDKVLFTHAPESIAIYNADNKMPSSLLLVGLPLPALDIVLPPPRS